LPIAAIAVAIGSLKWRFQHDAALMLYVGFAIDQLHLVPYRDVFDFNLPGAYFIYRVIGALSGYSELAVRESELALLAVTAFLSLRWMQPIGRRTAQTGAAIWCLAYLGLGPRESLQREFILMPALLLSLAMNDGLSGGGLVRRAAAGMLWGIVATIKPHAAIGFLLVGCVDSLVAFGARASYRQVVRVALVPALAGFSVPIAGVLLYLSHIGALPAFFDIALNYWPLYTHLSGEHEPLSATARLAYIVDHLRSFAGAAVLPYFLMAALVGVYARLSDRTFGPVQRKRVALVGGLAICYWLYPAFSGTFWPYHWIPCTYFVTQLMALCVDETQTSARGAKSLFRLGVLALALISALPLGLFARTVLARSLPAPNDGRVDQIAAYLKEHLQPGDTVQPLDWTGGAVHAMLLARAPIATPYLYDFYFYYDVSSPYVQRMRADFIERFERARPRYVVDVREHKAWIRGPDTSLEFPALASALSDQYRPVLSENDFVIYERLP
jgi:hypothetical protein